MKNASMHAREFKKLLKKIRKESAAALPPVEEPMEQLLRGILTDHAAEARANTALAKLREAVVDINELRVTPVSEIVEIIGADYPSCRRAAEEICRALIVLFNKLHHLDLAFLKKSARRTAETFLSNLHGINAHARATVLLRCFKSHCVPADVAMCEILRREGCVEPNASVEEIQKFLASQVSASQAPAFYAQFKKYASLHAPRKSSKPMPAPIEKPEPARETTPAVAAKSAVAKTGSAKKAAPKAARKAKPSATKTKSAARKSAARPTRSPSGRRRHR
jgi:endonuclease III